MGRYSAKWQQRKGQGENPPPESLPFSALPGSIFHLSLSWGWEALGLHEWPVRNLWLEALPHLEAVLGSSRVWHRRDKGSAKPSLTFMFQPSHPQTILSLLILLLHFHLCHQNIHFKLIASNHESSVRVRAMSHLDLDGLPCHALIPQLATVLNLS